MADNARLRTTGAKPAAKLSLARTSPRRGADFRVVAIGASAGGLEACTKLLDALPDLTGMAFILVQHLAPGHKSMLVELLSPHTRLAVVQAVDGSAVEREHLYVVPPASYLSVSAGILRLSHEETRDGAPRGPRLPIDALLHSLASEYGSRAVCVVLSGTGNDGSAGVRAINAAGGLVIVQDPAEPSHKEMPCSAIATGLVDAILPVAAIPAALARPPQEDRAVPPSIKSSDMADDPVTAIIGLLHTRTQHNFALYKRGTLRRRIDRRMRLALPGVTDLTQYLAFLRSDATELDLLAKDLLIHVTSFFRDAIVFDTVAKQVIPGLLRGRAPNDPVRVWVPGCSTGEEVYSLVILFREALAAVEDGKDATEVKLQVFASDIDASAVAVAREGLYAPAIVENVSSERLARFFIKEDGHGYRVHPDLRASVVFTVQDLLTDPPFSRLDLVSCRNLLIYLGPDAQSRAVSLFHFALKEGGALLLGSAEAVGEGDSRFKLVQKSARLYRHVGRARLGDLSFAPAVEGPRWVAPAASGSRREGGRLSSRQAALAELCRQAVLDAHAPAAVLCNDRRECLYSLGPVDRYLSVVRGHTTPDLLAMARGTLRIRLRSALGQVVPGGPIVKVPGGRVVQDGHPLSYNIEVRPLSCDGEALLLVCFVDALPLPRSGYGSSRRDAPQIVELERELETVRADLDAAHRAIEIYNEEQRAINEEAVSVSEEYQSANEELLTSQEELRALNEELTALNSQLQETLERQRTTSNDLQNILHSTDVATLFLDDSLNIRFFTPATRKLFNVIPGDIGRPLLDLHSLATDTALPDDARAVLHDLQPVEREVETPSGSWFRRRILPYRTDNHGSEGSESRGVVITFNDITRRKQEAAALQLAKNDAEAANLAKSRFLAAASHDLRQPLQSLALLGGLLARNVTEDKATGLVQRLNDTLSAMAGLLDTLLDLNQIEAGVVQVEVVDSPIGPLLNRLWHEFHYSAQAKGLALRVVSSSATVRTDLRLLEQMLRNLLSNALKYTERGRVLLGCRRHGGSFWIEVWDTGIGIPDQHLQAVFEEYHQIGNEAREQARGLGLGLSIVQRLGALLRHRVHVQSWAGQGSVFSIAVPLAAGALAGNLPSSGGALTQHAGRTAGTVLVVDDDPELRDLLRLSLHNEGYGVAVAPSGPAALDMVAASLRPGLVIADYNLPGGMTGLQLAGRLQGLLPRVPIIVLTGDISVATLHKVTQAGFRQLKKPVDPNDLLRLVQELLSTPSLEPPRTLAAKNASPVVFVVDDDENLRTALRAVLEADGHVVEDFCGGEAFLTACHPEQEGCLLVDAAMPGMDGLELLRRLAMSGSRLPAIMITGRGDVAMAVGAMKSGAVDFIEKPVASTDLLAAVTNALNQSHDTGLQSAWEAEAAGKIASLTSRQRDVLAMVLAGHPSKNIAADLGISQRTVENHRASIMRKTGAKSLPALTRLAVAAASRVGGPDDLPATSGAAVQFGRR